MPTRPLESAPRAPFARNRYGVAMPAVSAAIAAVTPSRRIHA
jgi:hypothetical protein